MFYLFTGDVTFTGAVGGGTSLTGLTITTDVLTAAAIKSTGTLSLTNRGASSITGIISNGTTALAVTKAGAGTLTLSATNTYTGATTISAGTLSVTGTLGSGTYSNTIENSGTLSIGTTNQTLSGIISGSGALTKVGAGILTLSAMNTYFGNTTVSAGELTITGAQSTYSNISVASGATYNANSTDEVGRLTGTGSVVIANGSILTITIGNGTITTFSGIISGSGNLGKTGRGIFILDQANTYSGNTFIYDGNLEISGRLGAGSYAGLISIAITKTLTVSSSSNQVLSGIISGDGSIVKSGTGALTLSGNNTYTGTTTVNAGILSVASIGNGGVAGNLGQATNAADKIVLSGGTLQYTGATASTNRNFTLTAGTTSKIDISNAATVLTISGASTNTTGSITKEGAGTLELTGTNLHTGATAVSTGTLKVNTGVLSNSTILVSEGAFCIGTGCPVTITNIYLVIGSNQSTIYGEEYALAYYFSTSPTDHTAGVGSTGLLTSAYYFTAGATNYSPGITGVTGSVTLSTGLTSSLAANTYDLTLTPSLTKSGINFLAGNSKDFIVNKATLTVTADNKSKTYGDANPSLTYTITGYKNSETSSVLTGAPTISTAAGTGSNVGSYTITSAANNLAATNYQFSYVNGSLTISTRPITVTAADKSRIYGDSNPALTYAVATDNGTTRGLYSSDTLTGTLATTAVNTTNVGTVSITQGTLANSNYAITFTNGTLTIGKATLTVTADNKSKTYGDANPSLTYTITGYKNSETSSVLTGAPTISTAAGTGSNVGSYTITSAANNLAATNYQFSYVNGSLTISTRPITVTAADKSRIYGDSNPALTYAVATDNGTTRGLYSSDTLTGTLATTAVNTTNVGTVSITQGTLANSNYAITFTNGTLTIGKATLTVTADNKSKTYGDANPSLTYTITGYKNSETSSVLTGAPTISTAAGTGSNVGSYTITSAANNLAATNYQFSYVNGSLTISTRPITVTAADKSRIYGDSNPALTYAVATDNGTTRGLYSSDTLTGTLATTAVNTTNVGTVSITQGTLANSNYAITFTNGTLTIGKATLTVTADNKSKTYGDANPSLTYTITGYKNSETSSVLTGAPTISTAAGTGSNVGSYTITSAANNLAATNYQFSYVNGSLTINRKPITVSADNKNKIYGAANPIFTYAVAEDLAGLSAVTGSLATTAATTSAVGTFDITQGTVTNATNGNYDITFTNGTLTINRKPITVTADNKNKIYGAANPIFTYAVAEDLTGLSAVTGSLATTAGTTTSVGAIDITQGTVTNTTNGNYDITFTNGTLTINKAALSITASNQSTTYGTALALGTSSFATSGLINSDSVGSVTLQYSGSSTVPATTSAATYASGIVPSAAIGTGLSNYTISYVNGNLTVNTKALSITANAQSTTYGTPYTTGSGSTAFTSSGLINSDSISSVTLATNQLVTTAAGASGITVTPSSAVGTGLTNYNITYNTGAVTIGTKALTVTANAQSTIYGTVILTGTGKTLFTSSGLINSDSISSVTLATTQTVTTNAAASGITVTPSAAVGVGLSNYSITYNTGAVTVNRKSITITSNTVTPTYDGVTTYAGLISSTGVTASGLVGSDQVGSVTQTYTVSGSSVSGSAIAQAVTFVATPSSVVLSTGTAENYNFSYAASTNTVAKANLAITAQASLSGNTYNGSAYTGTYSTNFLGNDLTRATITGAATGTDAGTYTSNLAVTGDVLNNYNTPVITNANFVVSPKPITISGITANGKEYDGTDSVTLNKPSVDSLGFIARDGIAITTSGAVASPDVGTLKTVTLTQSYTGTTSNYTITNQSSSPTVNITAKPITISGITANDKAYNGTNSVVLNKPTVDSLGFISRDGILINTTGVFDDVNVGAQTVTLTQSYGGTTSNYAITNQSTKPTASITPKTLTIGAATVANKVYDGNTTANISSIGSLSGLVGAQTLNVTVNTATFDSADVGTGRVAAISYSLSDGGNGGLASNYSLADTTASANIGKRTITISGIVAADKQFDGTNNVTLIKPSVSSLGFHTRDNIVITTTGTFDAVDLGMQTVTLVQSYSGTVSNYNIINQTIKPRAAITELIVNKVINNRPAPNHNFITIQLSIMTGREFMPLNPMARFKLPDDNRAQTFKDNNINVQNMNIVNMNPPPPNTNFTQNNNFINPRVAQPIIVQPDTSNLKPMMLPKFDNVFKKSPFSFLGIDLDVDNEVLKDIKLNKIFIDGGAKSNGNVIGIELN
jgi:autotransporter-associated beta strand protein